ncbi:MAG: hypothetical protein PHX08_15980 [Lachnospiraceae bacterium]|nr:hypothetical protein [Lachnospiraceae bacterium]
MFKPTKLLKVMSILMLIFGVIGVISTAITMATLPKTLATLEEAGMDTTQLAAQTTPLLLGIGIVIAAIEIIVAILALRGKKYKIVMAGGILLVLYSVYSIVTTFMTDNGFQTLTIIMSVISMLFPALFLWGAYQSEEVE